MRTQVPSVIATALESVRPAADAKQVTLDVVLDPDAGDLDGDAVRLQQVAWNLLSNAVKFTPRGGSVRVELRAIESQHELIVSDDGQGIEPSLLPHVFERFIQGNSTSTRENTGLGLGLALAKHLVELHGGTIRAESGGTGKSATFTVRLPITQMSAGPARDQAAL